MRLAARFTPDVDAEQLKVEYEDYQLLGENAITLLKDGESRPIDHVWADIMTMKTPLGVIRFHVMATVMGPPLPLPYIAMQMLRDCSPCLAFLRKVHTEARHILHADAIIAYLQCMLNIDSSAAMS